ncbi:MAG: 6-phosphogluconolactonase [Polyangiaceae bacterium]|nr:6-phosphogluconolactonase [Polyangiaceae bacterium]
MSANETLIAENDAELAHFAAELMGRAIADAVRERGVARVALSGGTTPGEAYRLLAAYNLSWDRVEWFWVDERAVPPSSDRSNYRAACADLGLDRAPLSAGKVHRMTGESTDLEAAARDYERLLRASFGVALAVRFDVMTLGIGDDGHTASLFPGMSSVHVTDRLVVNVPAQPQKNLEARLTLSAPVLCEAGLVLVLAKGAKKRSVLIEAQSPGSLDAVPSRIIQQAKGRVVWILDRAAAP